METNPSKEIDKILDFLFEVGYLKKIPRSGWLFAGVELPESVAEHSFRTAIVGMILALSEGANVEKVIKMCLLHDIAEARLLDLPSRTKQYLPNKESIEQQIFDDITRELPREMREELVSTFSEYLSGSSTESVIAKDADKLEMMLQAIEYARIGYNTKEWVIDATTSLKTTSARNLAEKLKEIFNKYSR